MLGLVLSRPSHLQIALAGARPTFAGFSGGGGGEREGPLMPKFIEKPFDLFIASHTFWAYQEIMESSTRIHSGAGPIAL